MVLWVRNTKGLGLGFLFEGRVGEKNGGDDQPWNLGGVGIARRP